MTCYIYGDVTNESERFERADSGLVTKHCRWWLGMTEPNIKPFAARERELILRQLSIANSIIVQLEVKRLLRHGDKLSDLVERYLDSRKELFELQDSRG